MRRVLAGSEQTDLVGYSVLTRVRLFIGRDSELQLRADMWAVSSEVRGRVHHIGEAVIWTMTRLAIGMGEKEVGGGGEEH